MESDKNSYVQPTSDEPTKYLGISKPITHQDLLFHWSIYLKVLFMIGWSKMQNTR